MEVALQSHITARKTSNGVIRDSRHFALEGVEENIWLLFEGNELGEELFDELCEQVFTHVFEKEELQSLAAVERFELAMRSLNEKLVTQAAIPNDFLQKNSFIVLLTIENQLHFTVVGNGEVYFVRGQKVFHASEGISAEHTSDDLFLNIASGESQDGDVLFISTIRLLRYISNAQMLDISRNSAKDATMTLKEFINTDEGGVFGVIKAQGAPALPFENAETPRNITQQKKNGFSFHDIVLPSFVSKWVEKIPVQSNKKEFLFLGIGIVALLLLWSLISLLSGGISGETSQARNTIVEIEKLIKTAEAYRLENNTKQAIEILDKAEEKAKDVINGNSPFRGDAEKERLKIKEIRDDISGTLRVSGTSLINIAAKKPDTSLQGVFFFEDGIFTFDKTNLFQIIGNAVETSIDLKEGEEVIGGVPLEQKKLKVFLTNNGKIIEVSDTQANFAKTEDPVSWKKATAIGSYFKNIYLLSPENNDIYKYVRKTDTYSSPVSYNKDGNLRDAISIAIDGSIFVLKKGGKVVKMFQGSTVPFDLVDIPKGFETVDTIYTLPEIDLLIFMDSKQKRIYIFEKGEKGATFTQQIVLEDPTELSGLAFDLGANRLLVSGTSKVHEVQLR